MKKKELTWIEVETMLSKALPNTDKFRYVYGVPRGGIYVALLVSKITGLVPITSLDGYDIGDVLVVDDIIDSGRTRNRFSQYSFVAVVDKKQFEDNCWVEFPWEKMKNESPAEDVVIRMLEYIGEDVTREGLIDTPKRVVKAWDELFSGYNKNVDDIFRIFGDGACDEMVVLRNIEFYSMCEHHILPFFGKVHIAYIPNGKVIGVSKLARLVEIYSKRLQIQERLAQQITSTLMQYLQPKGAACVIEAQHLCMQMRGVRNKNSVMVTSSLQGVFLEKLAVRDEFMRLIKNS